MEQKQTTPPSTPQWAEDMQKWLKENKEQRAVLCIATDNSDTFAALYGSNLRLMAALLGAIHKDSAFADVCRGALTAEENPIAALALMSALEESKEGEIPTKENEDKTSDPSIKESLKTILSKLADKL